VSKDLHLVCNDVRVLFHERKSLGVIKCIGCLPTKMGMLLDVLMTSYK